MKCRIIGFWWFFLATFLFSGCQFPQTSETGFETPATSTGIQITLSPSFTPSVSPSTTSAPLPTVNPAEIQLAKLYQASLGYLADNDDETWRVARSLAYAPLGGYPSNMCGPLAISIMRDAGLVSRSVQLHDFWLLNPPEDGKLLQSVFPEVFFEWLHTDQPINGIDYGDFPLKAGDLVYIYSGRQGDYSHVLVVTRVDAEGRAFSVTNNYTDQGFLVQEYLLYDSGQPGEGIFYDWPDPANRDLGLTGFGGMDVWRPIQLPYYADGAP